MGFNPRNRRSAVFKSRPRRSPTFGDAWFTHESADRPGLEFADRWPCCYRPLLPVGVVRASNNPVGVVEARDYPEDANGGYHGCQEEE